MLDNTTEALHEKAKHKLDFSPRVHRYFDVIFPVEKQSALLLIWIEREKKERWSTPNHPHDSPASLTKTTHIHITKFLFLSINLTHSPREAKSEFVGLSAQEGIIEVRKRGCYVLGFWIHWKNVNSLQLGDLLTWPLLLSSPIIVFSYRVSCGDTCQNTALLHITACP